MKSCEVLCIAETCCDLIFGGLARVPAPGGEEYCREFAVKAGGGSNTAMGLARLGVRTRLLTQIGQDALGRLVTGMVEAAGVEIAPVPGEGDVATAVSAVLSVPGDRSFASYGGSPFRLTEELLDRQIRDCRHVHTYLGYCLAFPIAQLCSRYGKTLSLDLAGGDTATLEEAAPVLRQAAFLTPNEGEACRLAGVQDVEEAMRVLAAYCGNVVVTCGDKGSRCICAGREYRAAPVVMPGVKDATGAGDLFCAGYLSGFLQGWDAGRCLAYGNRAGALAVTYLGGMDDCFTKENVEKMGEGA